MSNWNKNAGYGQALLNMVQGVVPTFGNIFVVMRSSNYTNSNYQHVQEVFSPDADGRIRFFTSLAEAYAATESNNNDVILLDANGGHDLTAMLSVAKNRVHFIGMDGGAGRRYGQRARVSLGVTTAATDIATVQVTGVGCTFRNIKFSNSNTVAQGIYCFVDAGEYTYIENCEVYKSTDLNETGAAEFVANGDSSHYKNCTFGSNVNAIVGAIVRACVLVTREIVTGKVARDVTFEGCLFWRNCGNAANRFVYGSGATDVERMMLFKDCIFFNTKLAAGTPAQSIAFGSSLTEGYVLVKDCTSVGSATAMSTTTGVFTADTTPDATGAAAGIAIQCA